MASENELRFESPTFVKRLRGMLGVDFYRLFHTPMFFIFIFIAAAIPALILGTGGGENPMYNNTWQMVAANAPLYIISDISEYANMNMVFIFGGIMVSVFIGHDYKSGYVKQLFTTHAKKQDYIISKTLTGAFSMAAMCIAYLIGTAATGIITGADMEVSVPSLIIAVLGKIVMSLGWSALYTFLNIIFRRYFGISIASSFFIGTGIPVIGAAAILGNNSILNIFLYGSSVNACLSADLLSLFICAAVSVAWTLIYTLLGTAVLNKCDVY